METLEDRRQLNTNCLTSASVGAIVSFGTNRTGKRGKEKSLNTYIFPFSDDCFQLNFLQFRFSHFILQFILNTLDQSGIVNLSNSK